MPNRNYIADVNVKKLGLAVADYTPKYDGLNFHGGENIELVFNDTLTAQEETGVDAIVEEFKTKTSLHYEYLEHTHAGCLLFDEERVSLRIMYDNGDITAADANHIENALAKVKSDLCTGDWITAQYELTNNVTPSGALTQELYDDIKTKIDEYVAENYGPE